MQIDWRQAAVELERLRASLTLAEAGAEKPYSVLGETCRNTGFSRCNLTQGLVHPGMKVQGI